MGEKKKQRQHSAEFRIDIAQRMLAGENVSDLSHQHQLPRSMMYRWRDTYREQGKEGLQRSRGRPPGIATSRQPVQKAGAESREQRLRQRIAELERKVGQQAVEIDFVKQVFKRVEELPKARRLGGDASTEKP